MTCLLKQFVKIRWPGWKTNGPFEREAPVQKVDFLCTKSYFFGHNFWASGLSDGSEILSVKKSAGLMTCLLKLFAEKQVIHLGEKETHLGENPLYLI